MLDTVFKQLGLSDPETRAYLGLLEAGPSTASTLAKRMSIPRTSLYGFLSGLSDKGLVTKSSKDGVTLWKAKSPELLIGLLEKQASDIEQARHSLEKMLPSLKAKEVTDLVTPRFHYFEGAEGVKHLLRDMLLYKDMETEAFWPIRDMIDILGTNFFEYLNERRIKQNLYTKAIWPKTKTVDISRNTFLGVGKEFKREIREAPTGITTSMGYWAYGNKVAFLSSRKESFGFLVESAELRQMMKTQFEVLWSMSKPVTAPLEETKEFLQRHHILERGTKYT